MRKITREAVSALYEGRDWKSGNTKVRDKKLYLHDSCIAYLSKSGELHINLCGWNTMTTRERLNGLDGVSLRNIKGIPHLNGVPIPDNEWMLVK